MSTSPKAQTTDFTKDSVGRFIFNGLDEALASTAAAPAGRPFDIVVVGGGTFGSAMAQHLLFADRTHSHRILVLEGGPYLLPEHVQNMPMIGLNVPSATSIAALRAQGLDRDPREEVWGLPWHSSTPYPGLAYCVGGRSLYFGGWSPRLLDEEMPTDPGVAAPWPAQTVHDLVAAGGYFDQAAEQIGVTETNDFISGPLHEALRKTLFDGIVAGRVTDAIKPADLPLHLDQDVAAKLVKKADVDQLKLEAPLAVQGTTRPGFFPFNKFSAMTLLIQATRSAQSEANNQDPKKRLMVVPRCHVTRLDVTGGKVVGVFVNQAPGYIALPPNGRVVVAMATVESTRLALLSLRETPGYERIGQNLMAHLRSNLTIRVPRTLYPIPAAIKELETSALFVKGRHRRSDGSFGHFHLQITAAGVGARGADSEAELFKKIPDIDTLNQFDGASDSHVVITIRGIGEMEPQDPRTFVRLDPETDEFGAQRAFVAIQPTLHDGEVWDAMDQSALDVAKVFGGGQLPQILANQRDGLGTTHHEAGTLWMGEDPARSVTDGEGRFHGVENAYAVGPALFPTIGSPNPMLSGIALVRRTADRIIAATRPALPPLENGFQYLFDGTVDTFKNWQQVGGGDFFLVDGTLVAEPWGEIGLLYYVPSGFGDFTLRMQFRLDRRDDNSGVFVRFQDPQLAVPRRSDPTISDFYTNKAWVAVDTGFEVQIDETAAGNPPDLDMHRTGAVYSIPVGNAPGEQAYQRGPGLQPGDWNDYEIHVAGQTYVVKLNGQRTTTFANGDAYRGKSGQGDLAHGFVGLQTHTGRVAFRNVRIGPA